MSRDNRRYPRARVDQRAEVELRTPRHHRVPATIRTASARGLGLQLEGKDGAAVLRGRTVTVHFALDREKIQLPAKVAWHKPDPDSTGAGVLVHLEIAGATMRQSYQRWVEQQLRSNRA